MTNPREAEVAAENYFKSKGYVTRRALRTKFNKVDFFGSDIIAMNSKEKVFCQVTMMKKGASVKRKKLEEYADYWLRTDRVFVFELRTIPNPVNRAVHDHFFRVHEFNKQKGDWTIWDEAIPVPRSWFKVNKPEE